MKWFKRKTTGNVMTNKAEEAVKEAERQLAIARKELEREKTKSFGDDWVPESGELYCLINGRGDILAAAWTDCLSDKECLEIGNVYHPSREPELKRTIELKMRFRRRVKELGGRGFVKDEDNYYLLLKVYKEKTDWGCRGYYQSLPHWMYVPTEKAVETLIEEFTYEEMNLIIGSLR